MLIILYVSTNRRWPLTGVRELGQYLVTRYMNETEPKKGGLTAKKSLKLLQIMKQRIETMTRII